MNASTNTILALAVLVTTVSGQVQTSLMLVRSDDPIRPILDTWRGDRNARYEQGKAIQAQFSAWREIKSEDLRAIFPNHRFAVITWHELEHPQSRKKTIGRAFGLQMTLAIDSTTQGVTEFFGFGNYESFGRFLAQCSVSILTEADAKRVWAAFCDLHQKHWRDQAIVRVDKSTWHLGVTEDSHHTQYYYEVVLDPEGKVLKGKLYAVNKKG